MITENQEQGPRAGPWSWLLDAELPGCRMGLKNFPIRETMHTQEHPNMQGPSGVNLQHARLPESRALSFSVGSGESMSC